MQQLSKDFRRYLQTTVYRCRMGCKTYSALNDYQDYGTEEANIADSIQAKIATIYKLTN